jgi:hypothetical protein
MLKKILVFENLKKSAVRYENIKNLKFGLRAKSLATP